MVCGRPGSVVVVVSGTPGGVVVTGATGPVAAADGGGLIVLVEGAVSPGTDEGDGAVELVVEVEGSSVDVLGMSLVTSVVGVVTPGAGPGATTFIGRVG
jgi:hypothetical protein